MADKYASWFAETKGIYVTKEEELLPADSKELDALLEQIDKDIRPAIKANDTKKVTQLLHKVNKSLLSKTFLVWNSITIGDIVFYVFLHPIVETWTEKDRLIFLNLTRWFDHVQHLVVRDKSPDALPLISINVDLPFAPKKPVAKAAAGTEHHDGKGGKGKGKEVKEPTENREKEEAATEHQDQLHHAQAEKFSDSVADAVTAELGVQTTTAKPGSSSSGGDNEKKEQADKKGKGKQPQQQGGKKGAAPAAAAAPQPQLSEVEDVSRLDIRVGKILSCKKHENADSLYIEQIDVGEEPPRQVVSGLVKFIPLDEMQNRHVLLLCNLKASNLKGVRSQAMVLAASNEDHTKVELVDPPVGAKIGERVTFDGFPGDPEKVLKKETLDIVLADLHTNADLVATYKNSPFTTSAGVCTAKSISNGGIR